MDLPCRAAEFASPLPSTAGVDPVAAHRCAVVFQQCKSRQLLACFNHNLPGLVVLQVRQRFAVQLHRHLRKRRVRRIRISPAQIQNRIREFSAVFLVEIPNAQENLRNDVLIQPRLSWRRYGRIFPSHPPRGIRHAAVFFRKARAWQPVHGRIDSPLLVGRDSRGPPELAGFILINFAHDQPIGLLQRVDIFIRVRADHHAVHSERQHALHFAVVHIVPDMRPRIIAIRFRQVIEAEVRFLSSPRRHT